MKLYVISASLSERNIKHSIVVAAKAKFQPGDHVRVLSGKHKNERGTVIGNRLNDQGIPKNIPGYTDPFTKYDRTVVLDGGAVVCIPTQDLELTNTYRIAASTVGKRVFMVPASDLQKMLIELTETIFFGYNAEPGDVIPRNSPDGFAVSVEFSSSVNSYAITMTYDAQENKLTSHVVNNNNNIERTYKRRDFNLLRAIENLMVAKQRPKYVIVLSLELRSIARAIDIGVLDGDADDSGSGSGSDSRHR